MARSGKSGFTPISRCAARTGRVTLVREARPPGSSISTDSSARSGRVVSGARGRETARLPLPSVIQRLDVEGDQVGGEFLIDQAEQEVLVLLEGRAERLQAQLGAAGQAGGGGAVEEAGGDRQRRGPGRGSSGPGAGPAFTSSRSGTKASTRNSTLPTGGAAGSARTSSVQTPAGALLPIGMAQRMAAPGERAGTASA